MKLQVADVWSCGVTLYVSSLELIHLKIRAIRGIFARRSGFQGKQASSLPLFHHNPEKRITMQEIKNHPWFLKNLPAEMSEEGSWERESNGVNEPSHTIEEISWILQEARNSGGEISGISGSSSMDLDDIDTM
ncbi:PREDICTED: serine/threonine-protein kinase SAPK2-like [Tarenaya hassleriana]|uniref:serine/threonine-protein kinase SAPK2-like n=1 Tax=Tarenaya hassleriana TaxID=28532 RepID=UPI00053C8CE0|nr:PREDICTED: serine/threonine-protein kinase SAPK2-like [Tarenaya hassleriana]